jgi:hypothetical protein
MAISDSTEMGIVALLVGVKIPKSSNFVVFMGEGVRGVGCVQQQCCIREAAHKLVSSEFLSSLDSTFGSHSQEH